MSEKVAFSRKGLITAGMAVAVATVVLTHGGDGGNNFGKKLEVATEAGLQGHPDAKSFRISRLSPASGTALDAALDHAYDSLGEGSKDHSPRARALALCGTVALNGQHLAISSEDVNAFLSAGDQKGDTADKLYDEAAQACGRVIGQVANQGIGLDVPVGLK